ncbi:hypothetical protein [Paenibacillus lignilyticus]|uniref:Uncharacterized protein n=1 Tax=Paenibacillus lignilyticus TaxID=1172615 RepID=A0ABS5CEB7_9BACL|nr:hypothetical protein [Paenibacillus lignilyticus]MBP3963418.1 hypothetical protein [Paenibacillus lignilyticus]
MAMAAKFVQEAHLEVYLEAKVAIQVEEAHQEVYMVTYPAETCPKRVVFRSVHMVGKRSMKQVRHS